MHIHKSPANNKELNIEFSSSSVVWGDFTNNLARSELSEEAEELFKEISEEFSSWNLLQA
jgi:hypothetical protein